MIFRNVKEKPYDGQIFSFMKYIPGRFKVDDGGESRRILDYKDKKTYMIQEYARHLNKVLGEGFALAVIPSSSVENNYNSVSHITAGVIIQLARQEGRVISDATNCLTRVKSIKPRHCTPGIRSEQIHLDTIEVRNPQAVAGRKVVVLDDIVTSGASMRAACKLLKAAGASKVVCIAMGRTLSEKQILDLYGRCA